MSLIEADRTTSSEALVVAFKWGDQKLLQSLLMRKLFLVLGVFFDLLVQRFNEIAGVDTSPDGFGKAIEHKDVGVLA